MLDLSDGRFLRTLRMIRIVTRRIFKGQKIGSRKTLEKGASVDFKDYKEYNPGDDPRFIDWNVYGRLDRVLVKIFHSEEDVNVYVLLDASQSMSFGSPSKFDYARQVGAAIAYLATTGHDRCRLATFNEGLKDTSPHADRPGHVLHLLRFLEKTGCGGPTRIQETISEFALRFKRRGVLFVLSDLFTATPMVEALRTLRYAKYDVNLVRILTPEELSPTLGGVCHLVDSEDESVCEVTIDPLALETYKQVLEERDLEIEQYAKQYGINYVRASTADPFENTVLNLFGARRPG